MKNRLGEVVGHSSPPRFPDSVSPSPTKRSPSRSQSFSPNLPLTQTLGESSLADQFARPARSRSSSPDDDSDLLIQAPPAIGLTRAVREGFAKEEAARTRREAVTLSQSIRIEDDEEDDGGGFHFASPAPAPASTRHVSSQPIAPITPIRKPKFTGGGFRSPTELNPFPNWGSARSPGRFPSETDSQRRGRLLRAIHVGLAQR